MTTVQKVSGFLQEKARDLRPPGRHLPARLIRIANDLGVSVSLVLRPLRPHGTYHARCQLQKQPPQILIYRNSDTAAVAPVTPASEHILTPRERFSVAHELGHCIAYQSHGMHPVAERDDAREYWRHERVMNEFASALLVPHWICSEWKSQLRTVDATCLFRVRRWANDCRVSHEVVVNALTRDTEDIGFLKVAEATRMSSNRRLLVVFHSCSGSNIALPNLYSHLDDVDFVDTINGRSGVQLLHRCRFGPTKLDHAQVAWITAIGSAQSRRREFRTSVRLTGALYWICLYNRNTPYDSGQNYLRL